MLFLRTTGDCEFNVEEKYMTAVGIIGCGFVIGASRAWLEKNNQGVNSFTIMPQRTPFPWH